MYKNIAVIGASGAIGNAFVKQLAFTQPKATINAFTSRTPTQSSQENVKYSQVDYSDESSIAEAATLASQTGKLDFIVVTTGLLQNAHIKPEKSLRDLSSDKFQQIFMANTIVPALVAKHFLPRIERDRRAVFAAVSARAGSNADNVMGGWYAYRAAKAALNMTLKNASIEIGRRYKHAVVVGLYPGTVDSDLSKPFQRGVPEGKLFTPEFSVEMMLGVVDDLTPEHSGKCFDWDGEEVDP